MTGEHTGKSFLGESAAITVLVPVCRRLSFAGVVLLTDLNFLSCQVSLFIISIMKRGVIVWDRTWVALTEGIK